ncbi:MAG: branched-chain amino acid transport system II carrier protein, partial [Cetobacterium sp.]|nr:branched-chain amino acid transport system II carrier protein [Cetobacterium sp.]
TLIGFFFSNFGVNTIVKISAPILVFLYPIAIVLIFLNIIKKYIHNDFIFKGAVLGSGLVGFIEMINSFGLKIYLFEKIYSFLPFNSFGLAWFIPAIITSFIFNLFSKKIYSLSRA